MDKLYADGKESKGTILFMKCLSQYNVLRVAADQVVKGFLKKGYNVDFLDLGEDENLDIMAEYIVKDYLFVFSMQAAHFLCENDKNEYVINYAKAPNIGWIFDDALLHYPRIMAMKNANAYMFTVDSLSDSHIKYYDFCNGRILYMPHGAIECPGLADNCEKKYDILFPGSICEYPNREEYLHNPANIYIADNAIEILKKSPELSPREAIRTVLANLGEEMTEQMQELMAIVIVYVNQYIRMYFREQILDNLARSGLDVHVLGVDSIGKSYPDNVTFHGSMDIEDVIDMMRHTKVLVNAIPNIYEGGLHERLLTGMLNDCIVYSPYTSYLEEHIGDRIEYIDLNDANDYVSRMRRSIDEYDKYEKFESNREYALDNTFEKRGEQLIDVIESEILHI